MSQIVRSNFNGGLIGKKLQWRSDLEQYQKSNVQMLNYLPEPYGSACRRPPLVGVGVIKSILSSVTGDALTPVDARVVPFVYSAAVQYTVTIVAYHNDAEDITLLKIHAMDGVEKASIEVPYTQADLHTLSVRHLNDVMYIAGQDYVPARLERHADDDWRLLSAQINGGPFLAENTDSSIELLLRGDLFDLAHTYSVGDVVQVGGSGTVSITAADYVYAYTTQIGFEKEEYYYIRLETSAAHTYKAGQVVGIHDVSTPNYDFNGHYEIKRIGSTWVDINIGTVHEFKVAGNGFYWSWHNHPTLPTDFTNAGFGTVLDIGFYASLVDNNQGNQPQTSPTHWRKSYQHLSVVLDSNQPFFNNAMVGQMIKLIGDWTSIIQGEFVDNATDQFSQKIIAHGEIKLETTGVWDGVLVLEKSTNDGITWDIVDEFGGFRGTKNHLITRYISGSNVLVRARHEGWTSFTGQSKCFYNLKSKEATTIVVSVREILTDRSIICNIESGSNTLRAFKTSRWAMGAFGGDQGYPALVEIHEERLLFAGTKGLPFMIWGSMVNDWTNFRAGTLATSPITFQAQSDQATRISWMIGKDKLFFGTDFGEYTAGSRKSETVLSAENPPAVKRHSSIGAAGIQAININNLIVYITTNRKSLRSVEYNYEIDGYHSPDLTILNPDIAGSGFRGMCLQRSPYPCVWVWTDDGRLCSFTLDRENNVSGWAEHSTELGEVKSACAIPDSNGVDSLYCVVFAKEKQIVVEGTCTPDVTGVFWAAPSYLYVNDAGSNTVNNLYGFYGEVKHESPVYRVTRGVPNSLPEIKRHSHRWDIKSDSIGYYNNKLEFIPPSDGWLVNPNYPTTQPPPPTIAPASGDLKTFFHRQKGYFIKQTSGDPARFAICKYQSDATIDEYFESDTFYGTYTPINGSTGNPVVRTADYHLLKMDQQKTGSDLFDKNSLERSEPYPSILEPTPLSRSPGFLEGKKKFRTTSIFVFVIDSAGGEVSVDGGITFQPLVPVVYDDENHELIPKTGFVEVACNSGYVDFASVIIRTTDEYPLTVTAITLDIGKYEKGGK